MSTTTPPQHQQQQLLLQHHLPSSTSASATTTTATTPTTTPGVEDLSDFESKQKRFYESHHQQHQHHPHHLQHQYPVYNNHLQQQNVSELPISSSSQESKFFMSTLLNLHHQTPGKCHHQLS